MSNTKQARVLTGITTTGTPHLGNYVGAIKPAIGASAGDDADSFLFLSSEARRVGKGSGACGVPSR